MSKNEITLIGDSYVDKQIVSGNVFLVQSLSGDELQYDELDATLDLCTFVPTLFVPKGADGMLTSEEELFGVQPRISIMVADPSSYKTGAVVLYKHNGALVGKYYMVSIERVSKTRYRIECVSPVGMLAKSKHYGGIYNGVLFTDLLAEIIGGVVPFTVAPDLAGQIVYGWLPIASRRDNLHQALFAMGVAAQKDENGDLYIRPLFDDMYTELPWDRIYTGGSVKFPNAASKVSVVEHSYVALSSDNTLTLFEGLVAAEPITTPNGTVTTGAIVLFDNPMHNLVIENGKILESGVNYAVLGPAGNCKLSGQQYTHTSRELIRPETGSLSDTEDVINVENATLVSVANSENVVNRLISYYGSAKTITLPIVVNEERAGSAVQFEDPFGEMTRGIVTSMDINMSGTLKADAEIVADYSPGNAGNFYTNIAVITKDGSWTVPAGVTKIRVVLIGGGEGGSGGSAGTAGAKGGSGSGGEGGLPGTPGHGGSIYISTMEVTGGQNFNITIGKGGAGGSSGTAGVAGGATVVGNISSANGSYSDVGYVGLLNGVVYATAGIEGIAGGKGAGKGSAGENVVYEGVTYVPGSNGQSLSKGDYYGECGYGGGPAAGANGSNGGNAKYSSNNGNGFMDGGDGGKGATPVKAKSGTVPGQGGQGGHGGGGGGGGGNASGDSNYTWPGSGGAGGSGGTGGNGANGAVLIYY